ncbi:MAG: glutathione S-transferase N-terminal domain-containing protein [Solirubrobacteraceae bacterium]
MAIKLFVVHGSHPCAAVQRALELKGLDHTLVELPPALHAPLQRVRFGARTVPSVVLETGEKVSGSRAIMRRLEEIAPAPVLYPVDETRHDVLRAEEWGDQVWQPIARRLLWTAFALAPAAMASFQEGSKLPAFPPGVLKVVGPVVTRAERRLNGAGDDEVRADLRALPRHLDRIDGWIEEGVIGGRQPNAADLQIGATTRLLLTIGDVRTVLAGRPAERHALDLWPEWAGSVPAGAYPAAWLAEARPAPV